MPQNYIAEMRPVLNKSALFSDSSADYVIPQEPNAYGLVTIRFRVAKNNVDRVFLICNRESFLMTKAFSSDEFDYYEQEIQLDSSIVKYYFQIITGKAWCFYDQRGVVKNAEEYYNFLIIPGFKTPKWAKGAVMYQIYIDRFYNGDKSNSVETNEYFYIGEKTVKVDDWNKLPNAMGVREFYGGDIQGVIDKLDYLEKLGVEAIYFNPLFVSPSNHKYDIQDYDYIDPHIGKIVKDGGEVLSEGMWENRFASKYKIRVTNKENLEASNLLFIQLVQQAHKRNIKVILDGVFNHCGSFNKWMDWERIYEEAEGYEKGAYISKESPYKNFFHFYGNEWPYNHTYDGWWGHDTLPKLNYEGSPKLYQYILDIGRKWVSPPYNADGWRLDVAADLGHSSQMNHQFWSDFRRAVKEANPNAIILAEHYGNPREWLNGREWDTVMNYDAFMEPITWFLTGMEKHSDDYREDLYGNATSFCDAMIHNSAHFPWPSLEVSMNQLSNHDHSRFLTRTNHKVGRMNNLGSEAANEGVNKAVFREAILMQMTWTGAPTIYYGDEAGLCGFTDPDNRRTYPWGKEDQELIEFHRKLIEIRKKCEELKTGSLKFIAAEYNVVAYGRFTLKNQCVIIVNNNNYEKDIEVKLSDIEIPKDAVLECKIMTDSQGFYTKPTRYQVEMGKLHIVMPGTSAILLRQVTKKDVLFII